MQNQISPADLATKLRNLQHRLDSSRASADVSFLADELRREVTALRGPMLYREIPLTSADRKRGTIIRAQQRTGTNDRAELLLEHLLRRAERILAELVGGTFKPDAAAELGGIADELDPPTREIVAKAEKSAGHLSPQELADQHGTDPEATRQALNRWRKSHAGGDGFIENQDRRPNEPQFLYLASAVESVMQALKSRQTRRTKSSGQRTAQE
jgi:hypothetical protein